MADLGFWALAQAEPSYAAVIDPEGGETASGELLASAALLG